jgi:hypothetical protein
LVASFYPLLGFALLNGLALYGVSWRFRRFVDAVVVNTNWSAALSLLLLVLLGALAFVLSAIEPALRLGLEGRGWPGKLDKVLTRVANAMSRNPPSGVGEWLRARQRRRLNNLRETLGEVRYERRAVRRQQPVWMKRLLTARDQGQGTSGVYTKGSAVGSLEGKHSSGQLVSEQDLEAAVRALEAALGATDANNPQLDAGKWLDDDVQRFASLLEASIATLDQAYARALAELESSFGAGDQVEPTAIGNVAATTVAYSASRYGIDLDRFHGVFEKAMRADEELSARLEATRTELSFLLACMSLAACTLYLWLAVTSWRALAALHQGEVIAWLTTPSADGAFLAIARGAFLVIPPLLLAFGSAATLPLWHWMISRKYAELATQLRAAVDLVRFDMLRRLHLQQPRDPRQERLLWQAQQRLSSFGEEADLRFEHPAGEQGT